METRYNVMRPAIARSAVQQSATQKLSWLAFAIAITLYFAFAEHLLCDLEMLTLY